MGSRPSRAEGEAMSDTIKVLLWLFTWIPGIVIANGFWSTAAAIAIPFYAQYLLAERLMHYWGIV